MDEVEKTQNTGVETERQVRRPIPVDREGNNDFVNGRGDVRGARGAESSADIIMAGING